MISLTDARRHLRIDGEQDDEEIAQKMIIADALVLAYCGHLKGDPYPLGLTAELSAADDRRFRHIDALDACRLLAIAELWANREAGTSNPLSPSVKNILNLFREPSYA